MRSTVKRVAHTSGLAWYTFTGEPLTSHPEFANAMLTRLGGRSSGPYAGLNLGGAVGDHAEAVATNHRRAFDALGITARQVVSPQQVHGNRVARITNRDGDTIIPQTDALVTDCPGTALLLRFADCAPVLFYDPIHHAIGLAHAGWRGVAAGIAPATVTAMTAHFDSDPAALWAGIGPAIGPDHYIVGQEVVSAIQETLSPGIDVAAPHQAAWLLDLAGAIEAQLHAAGVTQVDRSNICTACHTDEWYSHRAEAGQTGRFGVLVMLAV
jgi:polyphenol oxidase